MVRASLASFGWIAFTLDGLVGGRGVIPGSLAAVTPSNSFFTKKADARQASPLRGRGDTAKARHSSTSQFQTPSEGT